MTTSRPRPRLPVIRAGHVRAAAAATVLVAIVLVVSLVTAGGQGARAALLVPRTGGALAQVSAGAELALSPPPLKPGQTRWSVHPATAKTLDARALFDYTDVEPGAQIRDYVAVTNESAHAQSFAVYPSDAYTTRTGAYDLLPQAERSTAAGSWIRLGESSVSLAPHQRAYLPFTIGVPVNARPGDYSAGIVAQVTLAGGAGVRVDERIGARVYLRVAGSLRPALSVSGLLTAYHANANPVGGGSVTVRYQVTNTGNVRLGYAQRVAVSGWFGSTTVRLAPVTQLLPGNTLTVSTSVPDVWPAGPLTASVILDADAVAGVASPQLPVTDKSSSLFEMPWPQVLGIILLAACGLLLWLVVRRRRARVRALVAAAEQRGRAGREEGDDPEPADPDAAHGATQQSPR